MKKIVLLLAFLALPTLMFAQFNIGPTVYYGFPLSNEEADYVQNEGVSLQDFLFGLDTRLGIGLLDLGFNALVDPGYEYEVDGQVYGVTYIDLMPRIGLGLNIFFIRATLGIGPTFSIDIWDDGSIGEVFSFGSHAKLSVALRLGKITLAVNYLMNFAFDFTEVDSFLTSDKSKGLFGLSLLF